MRYKFLIDTLKALNVAVLNFFELDFCIVSFKTRLLPSALKPMILADCQLSDCESVLFEVAFIGFSLPFLINTTYNDIVKK